MLNFLEEIFLFLNRPQNGSSSKLSSFVVGTTFVASMLILILELNWVFSLLSIVKFLLTFSTAGLLIGFFIYFILVRTAIIKTDWKNFWTILVSCILLTISLSSKFNRAGLPEQSNERVLIADSPEFGETISRIPIVINDETYELRTTVENGNKYQKGEEILVVKYLGKLGFTIITA